MQQSACARFLESLRLEWRQALEQLVDNTQDVFDFFESKPAAHYAERCTGW